MCACPRSCLVAEVEISPGPSANGARVAGAGGARSKGRGGAGAGGQPRSKAASAAREAVGEGGGKAKKVRGVCWGGLKSIRGWVGHGAACAGDEGRGSALGASGDVPIACQCGRSVGWVVGSMLGVGHVLRLQTRLDSWRVRGRCLPDQWPIIRQAQSGWHATCHTHGLLCALLQDSKTLLLPCCIPTSLTILGLPAMLPLPRHRRGPLQRQRAGCRGVRGARPTWALTWNLMRRVGARPWTSDGGNSQWLCLDWRMWLHVATPSVMSERWGMQGCSISS